MIASPKKFSFSSHLSLRPGCPAEADPGGICRTFTDGILARCRGLTELGFRQAAALAERLQKELRRGCVVMSALQLSVVRQVRETSTPHPGVLVSVSQLFFKAAGRASCAFSGQRVLPKVQPDEATLVVEWHRRKNADLRRRCIYTIQPAIQALQPQAEVAETPTL